MDLMKQMLKIATKLKEIVRKKKKKTVVQPTTTKPDVALQLYRLSRILTEPPDMAEIICVFSFTISLHLVCIFMYTQLFQKFVL